MIKEFKTSKGEFFGVLVPKNWSGLTMPKLGIVDLYFDLKDGSYESVIIPQGRYKIIGIASELTEKQAKEIVDELAELIFKDYMPQTNSLGMSCFDTALESFNSLMQKLEIKPDTKTLIIQKIKQDGI